MADVRRELQNIGDIVVSCIEKTAGSAKKYAKGVALTYDIHEMNKKREQCLIEIGRRLTQVSKKGLIDVRKDNRLMELISEADSIEKALTDFRKEREELISFCSPLPKPAENTTS